MGYWLVELMQNDVAGFESRLRSGSIDEWTEIEFKEQFDKYKWKEHLAKAISGFANTDGGVLVFGVKVKQGETSRVIQPLPISDLERSYQLIRDHVSRAVEDPLEVTPEPIKVHVPDPSTDVGYIAVEVPRSERRPHRATLGKLHQYYLRAGEEFAVMPHGILRDMFSREAEPRPELYARIVTTGKTSGDRGVQARYALEVILANNGFGALRDPFLRLHSDDDENRGVKVLTSSFVNKFGCWRDGIEFSGLPGTVLHPKRRVPITHVSWGSLHDPVGPLNPKSERHFPTVTFNGIVAGSNFACRSFQFEINDGSVPCTESLDDAWWNPKWESKLMEIPLSGPHGEPL